MEENGRFLTRALRSMKHLLTQPMGGAKKPPEEPVAEAEPVHEPVEATVVRTKSRMWDHEFDIVDEGLDEDQIVKLVDQLMNKYRVLDEQRKHMVSLGTLSEATAVQADRAAADIRNRARAEAQAESARVEAEANQKCMQMMEMARKAARDAGRPQADSILLAARRKAAIIQTQAKQQAQVFLIRSREAIEGDLRQEVKEAYSQLLLSLQDLMGQGNQLEAQWNSTTMELSKNDTFEIDGYETRLPSMAVADNGHQTAGNDGLPEAYVPGRAQ